MRYEDIEKFLSTKNLKNGTIQISFRTRKPIRGLFIKTSDYPELSKKNLWRIVNEINLGPFRESKDETLARIFNGTEFTRLEVVS